MMMQDPTAEGMQVQLETLYAEREQLVAELGTADTEELVDMVRNLEAQLCDLYERYGHMTGSDEGSTDALLASVTELSSQLDEMYSEKSISVEIVNDKPILRAVWSESRDCQSSS